MKEWPEGSHIFMKNNPRVPGDIPIMDIGYKYNFWRVPGFISTKGSGNNDPGNPYLSCLPENYSNVSIHLFLLLSMLVGI